MYHKIYFLYQNYFWVLSISAVISLLTGKMWVFTAIMPVMLFYLAYKTPRHIRKTTLPDILMIMIFISAVISWLTNDYYCQEILIFRYLITQGAFMAAYYIGSNMPVEKSYSFFYYALLPMFICSILGFVFYVTQPAWYMANVENPSSLEALRLRSIFSSPYVCSYMSFFCITFLIANDYRLIPNYHLVIPQKTKASLYCVFTILLLFCMMRAPIAGVLMSVGFAMLNSLLYRGNIKRIFLTVSIAVCVFVVGYIIISNYMDKDSIGYLYEKFEVATDKQSDFYESRYKLYEANETFFGDGAGRHASYTDKYKSFSIRDTGYQRLKQEYGIFGFVLHMTLFGFIILKCLSNFKKLTFELCIMCFLMVSMVGAEPLGTPDKHSFIYWLIMGRVASFKRIKTRL